MRERLPLCGPATMLVHRRIVRQAGWPVVTEVAVVANPGPSVTNGRDGNIEAAVTRGVSRLPSNPRHERFRRGEGGSRVADALQRVDLVIFDCDGVIADSEVISANVLIRELLVYDIRIDADYVFRHFVGNSFPVVAGIIGERFGTTLPSTFVSNYRAALREAYAGTIARLCQDGSNRLPKFVLPTVSDALERGAPIDGLALEIAFWSRLCATAADCGIALQDSRRDQLTSAARAARSDPMAFLGLSEVFGDLSRSKPLAEAFARQLEYLWSRGPREALHRFFDGVEA